MLWRGIKWNKKTNGNQSDIGQLIVSGIDQNGNGEIDVEDFIILGLGIPGVGIDRDSFLRQSFQQKHDAEVVDDIVAHNPLYAGISLKEIEDLANRVIQGELMQVTAISAGLGIPGGIAMAGTIPADIAQLSGYMLRVIQKLMYLYGFPALNVGR